MGILEHESKYEANRNQFPVTGVPSRCWPKSPSVLSHVSWTHNVLRRLSQVCRIVSACLFVLIVGSILVYKGAQNPHVERERKSGT
ncbi:hypothetical protein L873DRAFT_297654 [Choiromyces venosus 120613-1]|uniref:Uncharacterized protein n=1 Tax=Choiromyces venosus 120613-1 TaxID=1336337 RepID=A0A3N4J0B2_9PEZI|nr:hypothetical protein L873DRAFT_297654 [Choiromyces venosus 120613-1]